MRCKKQEEKCKENKKRFLENDVCQSFMQFHAIGVIKNFSKHNQLKL